MTSLFARHDSNQSRSCHGRVGNTQRFLHLDDGFCPMGCTVKAMRKGMEVSGLSIRTLSRYGRGDFFPHNIFRLPSRPIVAMSMKWNQYILIEALKTSLQIRVRPRGSSASSAWQSFQRCSTRRTRHPQRISSRMCSSSHLRGVSRCLLFEVPI
jgi:hypothetical protein